MSAEQIANAALLVPAVIFGVLAWRARRRNEVTFGLAVRGRDLLGGAVLGAVGVVVMLAALVLGGAVTLDGPAPVLSAAAVGVAGTMLYLAVLFAVEEIVFRGALMTGLGVVAGRWGALVITAALVALPYALAPTAGVLAVVGEFVVNLVVGAARLRTGRIWCGWALRITWNLGLVVGAFADGGDVLAPPLLRQHATAGALVTGGDFGPEGGLVGIVVGLVMTVLLLRARRARAAAPGETAPAAVGG